MQTYSLCSGLPHVELQPIEDPACDECKSANVFRFCNQHATDDTTLVYCVIEPDWRATLASKGVTVESRSTLSTIFPLAAAHAIRLAFLPPICVKAVSHITCNYTAPQICCLRSQAPPSALQWIKASLYLQNASRCRNKCIRTSAHVLQAKAVKQVHMHDMHQAVKVSVRFTLESLCQCHCPDKKLLHCAYGDLPSRSLAD